MFLRPVEVAMAICADDLAFGDFVQDSLFSPSPRNRHANIHFLITINVVKIEARNSALAAYIALHLTFYDPQPVIEVADPLSHFLRDSPFVVGIMAPAAGPALFTIGVTPCFRRHPSTPVRIRI
jgi:hypothetical protein